MVRSEALVQTGIYAGFLSGFRELGAQLQLIKFAERCGFYYFFPVGSLV